MGIYAAPPGIPLLVLLIGAVARLILKKDGIQLLFPEIVARGAAINIVCFDKTGTLTENTVSTYMQLQTEVTMTLKPIVDEA